MLQAGKEAVDSRPKCVPMEPHKAPAVLPMPVATPPVLATAVPVDQGVEPTGRSRL